MTAKIKLNHSGGNGVSLNAPANNPSISDVAFMLPNADGSANQLLKTDGSGNLGWATDQGGKILQVVQKKLDNVNDYFTTTSTSFVEITGLAQTLTLSSSSNKVLIMVNLHTSVGGNKYMRARSQLRFGDFATADGLSTTLNGVYDVNVVNNFGYAYVPHTHQVLHTPSTATPTYRIGIRNLSSGHTCYVYADGNVDGLESSVVFMEIAA